MKTKELRAIHSSQKSFYTKAFIKKDDKGIEYLYSYYSLIVTNYGNELKFENGNLYSNTTMKHVREYLKQIGGGDLAALPKAKLFKKLAENNYIISNIV